MQSILESKTKSLIDHFRFLFGNLPMPALVHAADSADETAGRQRAKLDAYTVESDLPFLSSAHMEMRLVLALLCVLIRLQTVMENPGYERKFQAAQVLRDLVDGLIEELSTPVDAVGFRGICWGNQILPLKDGKLQQVLRSRLVHCGGWGEFQAWWVAVVTGELELPSTVVTSPATHLVSFFPIECG